MNWSTMQGNWKEAKGKVKTQWGKLTDDDLTQVEGNKDRLIGVIQQKYGLARDKAEAQLEEFLSADESTLGKVKENVQEVVEKGMEKGKEAIQQGKEAIQHGKDYVQNTSVTDMAGDLKDLIGRHPVYSAVIGVGLGFLIGRMLTSSKGS
jgi:uncharacterized protein YjbJ (UPF0337 family)